MSNYPLELYGTGENFTWRNPKTTNEVNFSNYSKSITGGSTSYSIDTNQAIASDSAGNLYQIFGGMSNSTNSSYNNDYYADVIRYNSNTKTQTNLGVVESGFGNYSYTSTYKPILALYDNSLFIAPQTGNSTSATVFSLTTNTQTNSFSLKGMYEETYWKNFRLCWLVQKDGTVYSFGHREYWSGIHDSASHYYNRFATINLSNNTCSKRGYTPIANQTSLNSQMNKVQWKGRSDIKIINGLGCVDDSGNIYIINWAFGFFLKVNSSNSFTLLKDFSDEISFSNPYNAGGGSFIFYRNNKVYIGISDFNNNYSTSFTLWCYDISTEEFSTVPIQNVDNLSLNSFNSGWRQSVVGGVPSFNSGKSGYLLGNYGTLKLDFEGLKIFKIPNLTSQLNKSNTKTENPVLYSCIFEEDTFEISSNIQHPKNVEFEYPINDVVVISASTETKSINGKYILKSNTISN